MKLIIVLTKEVPSVEQAQVMLDIVKNKLADQPEVDIQARVNTNLTVE